MPSPPAASGRSVNRGARQTGVESIKIGRDISYCGGSRMPYVFPRQTEPGNIVTNAPGSNIQLLSSVGTAFDIFRDDGVGTEIHYG